MFQKPRKKVREKQIDRQTWDGRACELVTETENEKRRRLIIGMQRNRE